MSVAEARRASSHVELVVDHLEDALLLTEGDACSPRRIVYVNRAFTKMMGFTAEEALGKTPDITVGPDTDRAALARIQEARAERRPVREELLKYRKDGSTIWVEMDVVPVFGHAGEVRNYLGVLREIGERKANQTRLVESDRLHSLSTLVAGIAHEINNPLAYVLANLKFVSEILGGFSAKSGISLSGEDATELRSALSEMELGAERVHRIVRDLRVFAHAEVPGTFPVNLQNVVAASLKLAHAELGELIKVEVDLDGCGSVMGDTSRMGEVFVNLLINAAQAITKAAPTGHVRVRGRREGDFVRVEVEDDGPGIAPENMRRIFQPFFTTKPVGVGTGLGLPICQSIVSAIGGRITVESELGVGTTVILELRAAP